MHLIHSTRDPEPGSLFFRAAAISLYAEMKAQRPEDVLDRFGAHAGEKAMIKAASVPAGVDTDSWAGALLEEQLEGLFELIASRSVFGALGEAGSVVRFRGRHSVNLPQRTADKRGGAFVGELAPVPARDLSFDLTALKRYKFASIAALSSEAMSATPAEIEGLIADALLADMARALDIALLDNTETDGTRPSGLLFGVTPTASAGTSVANIDTDLAALLAEFTGAETSELRLVMHPMRQRNLLLKRGTGGAPAFPELAGGTLTGVPVIASGNCPNGSVLMVRAREFAAGVDGPRFSVASDATMHMEDTTPLALVSSTGPTAADPVTSIFQVDAHAIRVVLPAGWALRSAGAVAALSSVAW